MRILGTAALSPLTDPLSMARELTQRDASAELSIMVAWVLVPYAEVYPDVNVEDYVATSGRSIVREMTQRCLSEPGLFVSALTSLGVSADEPLYPANLTGGPLGRRLAQNSATGPWQSPLLIGWSLQDEVIPPELPQRFVDDLCEAGVAVRWVPYQRGDHRSLIVPVLAVPADPHALDAGAIRPRRTGWSPTARAPPADAHGGGVGVLPDPRPRHPVPLKDAARPPRDGDS